MQTERGGPLEMLTVLDLSEGIAGPYTAMLFGQLGAAVIKVEPPGGGDAARAWQPFGAAEPGIERSLTFQAVNACKLSLSLDYETPEGAAVLRRLSEDADAIIDAYPTRRRAELGLGADELIARIPRLVVTQVSGYGATGPYAARPLTGLTLAAAAGVLPADAEGPTFDRSLETILGQNAFLATLAALWRASQTEHGQVVDVGGMHVLAASSAGPPPGGATPPAIDPADLRQQGRLHDVEHPVLGWLQYPDAPFSLSASPTEAPARAPLLGEHTDYVLKDLIEMDAAQIEVLRSRGIV
jgi:crotonobetainyl-CoA:carnitine CoA-transferase CaiB-like acyl-CoA transferase